MNVNISLKVIVINMRREVLRLIFVMRRRTAMTEYDIYGQEIDGQKYIYGSVNDSETGELLGWERIADREEDGDE